MKASNLYKRTARRLASSIGRIGSESIASFDPKSHQNLGAKIEQIPLLEKELSNASSNFEKLFLNILETLEEYRSISEDLSSQSEQMLSLSKSEDNPIRRINHSLNPLLEFINLSADSLRSLISDLGEDRERIDQTLSHEKRLNQTFSQLTYIRTLFRVESAPLDQKVKVMFTSLVDEIYRLQTDVSDIFTTNFQSLRQHKDRISRLINQIGVQAETQSNAFESKRIKLDKFQAILTQAMNCDIATNTSLNTQSAEISEGIGEAIVSLQVQDIVAQKFQHIREISAEISDRFARVRFLESRKERCETYRFIEHASIVIQNQIQAIIQELEFADNKICISFEQIEEAVRKIETLYSDASSEDATTSINFRNGSELLESLKECAEMIEQVSSSSHSAFEEILPMRKMASNVTETILGLSAQLHLIGLNAEVHAAQAGGSCGLEILSSKTSEVSIETRNLCQRVSTSLDLLVSNLNESVNNFEKLHESAAEQRSSVETEIASNSQRISHFNNSYRDAASNSMNCIQSLKELCIENEKQGDLKKTMVDQLFALQTLHCEISSLAQSKADSINIQIDIPSLMQGLLERYTMESEQAVHHETLGLQSSTPIRHSSGAPSRMDNRFDLGDFEATALVAANASSSDFGKNVELF